MRGVAGQKQAAVPHRLGDEAAQRRDALFDRRAGLQFGCGARVEAALQFIPEAIVAPFLDFLFEIALHIVTAARV